MSKRFNYIDRPLHIRTGANQDPNHSDYHVETLETAASSSDNDAFLIVDAAGRSFQQARSEQHTGWTDYLTSISTGRVPPASAPSWTSFGPSGNLNAYAFAVNDYIALSGFHINHDIKQGSKIYPHVHWSTDGTDTGLVEWELEFTYCSGHDQANFPAPTVIQVGEAAAGTAWRHMISEASVGDAFTAPEVDSIILMRVKRNSTSPTCSDTVFGLFVDLHVEIERAGTLNKSPNFYL